MSFFSESDEERRLRMDRERNLENQRRLENQRKIDKQRQDEIKRQKDVIRQKKRKLKDQAIQKEIDDEIQRLMDENSSEKKKAQIEKMTGSNLMQSAFGLSTGLAGNHNNTGLRSTDIRGSIMSQSRPDVKEDIQGNVKVPKLNRPF